MTSTTYYSLPKYETTDAVDLITGYNAAMDAIDTALHTIANTTEFNPQPSTDNDFDVSALGSAKITADGIIYFIAPQNNSQIGD